MLGLVTIVHTELVGFATEVHEATVGLSAFPQPDVTEVTRIVCVRAISSPIGSPPENPREVVSVGFGTGIHAIHIKKSSH